MRSWDLFGTLCVGRDINKRDGEQDSHFPVAELIAQVNPHDLIISDYHTPDKALHILREVARLPNELHVSHDDKATGAIWKQLTSCGQTPTLHVGDDVITDYAAPKTHGVKAELTELAKLSDLEQEMNARGFPGLAGLMREARLVSWSPEKMARHLQLFQAQINLPFLFFASILVHRRMRPFENLLLCARDCWLWHKLFVELKPKMAGDWYEVEYFYTSRLTRYFPSNTYAEYLNFYLMRPSMVVDLCGFGHSLKYLLGGRAYPLLLVGYDPCHVDCIIPGWMNEVTNFARHPMVSDVDQNGKPVYVNPLEADWEAIPELTVMHEAFLRAVVSVKHYDFTHDMERNDSEVRDALVSIFGHFDDYVMALSLLTQFRVQEAQATSDLLAARGRVEGVVV